MNQSIHINSQQTEQVIEWLWQENEQKEAAIVYVILDGARNKKIHPMLKESGARFYCLLEGKLNYSLTLAAPYIVRLEQNADFTRELIQQAWGNSWGIYAITHKPTTLIRVRSHCKAILHVRNEETQSKMLFRYYDPGILRDFLPAFTNHQLKQFFGPITTYAMEDKDAIHLNCYRLQQPDFKLETMIQPIRSHNERNINPLKPYYFIKK